MASAKTTGGATRRPLATGIDRPWKTQARKLSPRYTTHAAEILVAQAF